MCSIVVDEAQLVFELLKEKGFKDKFFEDKINFLLGITETTTQKIWCSERTSGIK